MLPTMFRFIWPSGFRKEDFYRNQPITELDIRIACGGHICEQIRTKWAIFIEDLPYLLPTKFLFIWPCSFRGEDFFRNWPIRNKNCLWWPCLLTDRDEMNNLYRGPYIDASYQVSVHLAKGFQGRRLKCEKFTDGKRLRWTPSDGNSSPCL